VDVTRRVGIMGGTFDPIHIAHLVAAQEAAIDARLDEVIFIPARQPPHKTGEPLTDAQHRLAMTIAAVAENPVFSVSTIEMDREGPSFTVETLRQLQATDVELFFIVGMDSLADLPTWREPSAIVELAEVIALYRGGWDSVDLGKLESQLPAAKGRVRVVAMPALDVSSTDIRRRVATGKPVRYLVPDSVIDYIARNGLYRD